MAVADDALAEILDVGLLLRQQRAPASPPSPACPSNRSPTAPPWCGSSPSAPRPAIRSADRPADIRLLLRLTFPSPQSRKPSRAGKRSPDRAPSKPGTACALRRISYIPALNLMRAAMPLAAVTRLRVRSAPLPAAVPDRRLSLAVAGARSKAASPPTCACSAACVFLTRTLWRDGAAMRDFMGSGAHRGVMPKLHRIGATRTSTVRWRSSKPPARFRNEIIQGVGGSRPAEDPSGNLVELFEPNSVAYRAPGSGTRRALPAG